MKGRRRRRTSCVLDWVLEEHEDRMLYACKKCCVFSCVYG
jgi:hypothetical protein